MSIWQARRRTHTQCVITGEKSDTFFGLSKCPASYVPNHGDLIGRDVLEEDGEWDEREDGFVGYSRAQIKGAPAILLGEKGD